MLRRLELTSLGRRLCHLECGIHPAGVVIRAMHYTPLRLGLGGRGTYSAAASPVVLAASPRLSWRADGPGCDSKIAAALKGRLIGS